MPPDPTRDALSPHPVRFETPVGELEGPVVVEDSQGMVTVFTFTPSGSGQVQAQLTCATQPGHRLTRPLAAGTELGDVAVNELRTSVSRAFQLPEGTAVSRHNILALAGRTVAALGGVAGAVAALTLLPNHLILLAVPLCVALVVAACTSRPRWLPPARAWFDSGTRRYRFEELLDARPQVEAARALVSQVKEEYGALLSDIVERIECPALFDPAHPATRRFTAALLAWDSDHDALTGAEIGALAAEVATTFRAARAEAQALGLAHLPVAARDPASRALKSARLASAGVTESERRSALRKTIEILDSLAIYYLPSSSDVTTMIEGRHIRALPGRRPHDAP